MPGDREAALEHTVSLRTRFTFAEAWALMEHTRPKPIGTLCDTPSLKLSSAESASGSLQFVTAAPGPAEGQCCTVEATGANA